MVTVGSIQTDIQNHVIVDSKLFDDIETDKIAELLSFTVKQAELEYFEKGLSHHTHVNYLQLSHEFNMRLTFSAL